MYAPPFRSGRNARALDDCIHCPCRTKARSFVQPVGKPFDVFILYRTTLISLRGIVQPRWVSGVEPHCGLLAWSAAKSIRAFEVVASGDACALCLRVCSKQLSCPIIAASVWALSLGARKESPLMDTSFEARISRSNLYADCLLHDL